MIEILIAVLIVIDIMLFVPFFVLMFDLWIWVMGGHHVYGFNNDQAFMALMFAILGTFFSLGTTGILDGYNTRKKAQAILDRGRKDIP